MFTYTPVGFLRPHVPPAPAPAPAAEPINPNDAVITYDDGSGLSRDTACRNVLVTGQTGSGKTTSVIIPIAKNLIKFGLGGIIFDVKGNLRKDIYRIAKQCGRQDDIIEYGSEKSANEANLIENMPIHTIRGILTKFVFDELSNPYNVSWMMRGVSVCTDICEMLDILSKIDPQCHFSQQFKPSLNLLESIINTKHLQYGLYIFFKEEINRISKDKKYEELYRKGVDILNRITDNKFHLLNEIDKRWDDMKQNQVTWNMQRIRDQLYSIKMTNGILERFSKNGKTIDFEDLIYKKNKVILIHFAIDTGRAGELISGIIKNLYYQAVIRNGLQYNKYSFMLGDEFQYIVDVNKNTPLNDMDLFCISRQFKIIKALLVKSVDKKKIKKILDFVTIAF